jgi:RNA polymerase sigma factor (sigma-70 family)
MGRHYFDSAIYCRAIDPVLSLDSISSPAGHDGETEPFEVLDPSDDPREQLEELELTEAAAQFVRSLSPKQARLVTALYWEGRTQSDIARELGVSRTAVSKAVRKIERAGRTRLADFKRFPS